MKNLVTIAMAKIEPLWDMIDWWMRKTNVSEWSCLHRRIFLCTFFISVPCWFISKLIGFVIGFVAVIITLVIYLICGSIETIIEFWECKEEIKE